MFGKRIPLPAFLWQGKPIACLPAGKRLELVFPYDKGNTNPMGGGLELDFGRCFSSRLPNVDFSHHRGNWFP